ncbi:hypothetical protein EJ04DRAFT_528571 [Polyplosphaeria fusca]|uniref:Uncharacterized protein n=1 Tax=Polyplosphaeria fusca TaxID=682080 RepID=A0A9P4UX53_9PLEO|nr:hypothetical protein EJ04DRAFT_528571 [Polyplosphaeria fusca]
MSEPNSEWTPIWSEDYKQHYYRRLVGGTWEITWQQPNPSQPDKTTSLHSPTTDPTAHGRSDSKFGLDSASIYHEANTGADNLDSTSGQHTPTAFSNDLIVNEPQHTRRPSQSTYSHTSAAYSSSEAYPQGPSQQPTSQYDHTHSSSNHLRQGFSNPAAPYQYPPQGGGPQYGNYFQHSNYPGHSNYPQHNNYSQHQHYKYPQPGNYTQLGNYSQASAYSQPGSYPQQDNYSQQNRGMYDTSLSTRPGHDRGQTSYTQHHTSARSEDSYGGSRGDEDLYIQNAGPPVATLNPYTLNESLDEAFSVKHRRFFQPGKVKPLRSPSSIS